MSHWGTPRQRWNAAMADTDAQDDAFYERREMERRLEAKEDAQSRVATLQRRESMWGSPSVSNPGTPATHFAGSPWDGRAGRTVGPLGGHIQSPWSAQAQLPPNPYDPEEARDREMQQAIDYRKAQRRRGGPASAPGYNSLGGRNPGAVGAGFSPYSAGHIYSPLPSTNTPAVGGPAELISPDGRYHYQRVASPHRTPRQTPNVIPNTYPAVTRAPLQYGGLNYAETLPLGILCPNPHTPHLPAIRWDMAMNPRSHAHLWDSAGNRMLPKDDAKAHVTETHANHIVIHVDHGDLTVAFGEIVIKQTKPITVMDLLNGIYKWLHEPVAENDLRDLGPDALIMVHDAFHKRMATQRRPYVSQWIGASCLRVDCLGDWRMFGGLRFDALPAGGWQWRLVCNSLVTWGW